MDHTEPAQSPASPQHINGADKTYLPALRPGPAAAIASLAYGLPLLLSIGANPAPTNPKTFAWYATLRKPRLRPPDAAVPLVWAAIETGLAVGAYRLLRRGDSPQRRSALAAWAVNVAMIGGWTRLFFGRRNLPASTAAAAAMVATGVGYVTSARRVDNTAGTVGLPFVGWVAFATVLTASIWAMNRR
jgi:tryptophan-rich sensory protein